MHILLQKKKYYMGNSHDLASFDLHVIQSCLMRDYVNFKNILSNNKLTVCINTYSKYDSPYLTTYVVLI